MLAQILALLTLSLAQPNQTSAMPSGLGLTGLRAVVVQHDGRWMPLDTAARDIVARITGDETFAGHDPVATLLAWSFDPNRWQTIGLIPIEGEQLKVEVELLSGTARFAYGELTRHRRLHDLVDQLALLEPGAGLTPLQEGVSDIHRRLLELDQVFRGEAIRVIPDPQDPQGEWRSVAWFMSSQQEQILPVRAAWLELRDAFLQTDGKAWTQAEGRFRSLLSGLPAAHRPDPDRIAAELRSNRLGLFRLAWIALLLASALALLASLGQAPWSRLLAIGALAVGFMSLTYGLYLRGVIADRLPAANLFESLLLVSFGAGFCGLLSLSRLRHPALLLASALVAGLSLCLADLLPLDHFIRPLPPALVNGGWRSVHAPLIMVACAVLCLAAVLAHIRLAAQAFTSARTGQLDQAHRHALTLGTVLLFLGLATGGVWACASWGRSFGFDPKETATLVVLLAYVSILLPGGGSDRPARWLLVFGGLLGLGVFAILLLVCEVSVLLLVPATLIGLFFVVSRGAASVAAKSILAFWLLVLTYLGLNLLLKNGLHSYGFSSGDIARPLLSLFAIDLVFVLTCLLRGRAREPVAVEA